MIRSWRGVRPVIHYSQPRQDVLGSRHTDPYTLPNRDELFFDGLAIGNLRAHSDYFWNQASNEWAWSFSEQFDIQTESKAKNLSQERFVNGMLNKRTLELI